MASKKHTFSIGDRVKYSRDFLRSTGQFSGPVPFAKGTVTEISEFGAPGRALVSIQWDGNQELPPRVLNLNLVREKQPEAS